MGAPSSPLPCLTPSPCKPPFKDPKIPKFAPWQVLNIIDKDDWLKLYCCQAQRAKKIAAGEQASNLSQFNFDGDLEGCENMWPPGAMNGLMSHFEGIFLDISHDTVS